MGGHTHLARLAWYPTGGRIAFVGHFVLFQGLAVADDCNLDAVEVWHGRMEDGGMEGEGEKRYCGRVPLRMATMLFDLCRVRQRVLRHVGIVGVYGFFPQLRRNQAK